MQEELAQMRMVAEPSREALQYFEQVVDECATAGCTLDTPCGACKELIGAAFPEICMSLHLFE